MPQALKYSVEDFFQLFVKELEGAPYLHKYYKFHTKDNRFKFRKVYFIQRLQYVVDQVEKGDAIWDCGCGYATTAIFLTLNGFQVFGTTLEFYYEDIEKRLAYWKQYGDLDSLEIKYENIFDGKIADASFDAIIAQDTLHHLEPFDEAIVILANALKENGKIVAIEENGSNIIQNIKLYKQRGNKKIITIYDEKLKKNILLGNENIRPIAKWRKEFAKGNLSIDPHSLRYVRLLLPQQYGDKSTEDVIQLEQKKVNQWFLRKYLFFGVNFVAKKC